MTVDIEQLLDTLYGLKKNAYNRWRLFSRAGATGLADTAFNAAQAYEDVIHMIEDPNHLRFNSVLYGLNPIKEEEDDTD